MSRDALFAAAATTADITVRAAPAFVPDESDPADDHWLWQYRIRIENGGAVAVQLLDRHWIITDGRGERQDVRGEGVVGVQPWIEPGDSYDYVSACPLSTPMGSMRGAFGMVDPDGRRFSVEIPSFDLLSPQTRGAAS